MKKIIIALMLVSSTAVLSSCGFSNTGCRTACTPVCAPTCATTTTYTYSSCGMGVCGTGWY
ncbi:hypothetical protein E3983_02260 [Legionella israelensis]|uniref:Uncharacterized protein n=1 Tax=Legionella israelensis TaxID=454 RepID=A0AAX1EDT7_9GAMM|nr:hypothetical protein [Legionella israelensis]QBR83286.1 hypothetical protein E3983_02260 [Legionella israelensis]QBS09337.1 hypothetical protein E4T55_05400 [Legionella israelensis]QDP71815.1 hypothetical protein FOG18_04110 [Legionella israelensis]STX60236.1 Uncharacterised protein [Legionella israelensis]